MFGIWFLLTARGTGAVIESLTDAYATIFPWKLTAAAATTTFPYALFGLYRRDVSTVAGCGLATVLLVMVSVRQRRELRRKMDQPMDQPGLHAPSDPPLHR